MELRSCHGLSFAALCSRSSSDKPVASITAIGGNIGGSPLSLALPFPHLLPRLLSSAGSSDGKWPKTGASKAARYSLRWGRCRGGAVFANTVFAGIGSCLLRPRLSTDSWMSVDVGEGGSSSTTSLSTGLSGRNSAVDEPVSCTGSWNGLRRVSCDEGAGDSASADTRGCEVDLMDAATVTDCVSEVCDVIEGGSEILRAVLTVARDGC